MTGSERDTTHSDRPTIGAVAGTLTRLVAAIGIAVALGLGARTAVAAPVYMQCAFNPSQGQLGSCRGDVECDNDCTLIYGFPSGGCEHIGGESCCVCPF